MCIDLRNCKIEIEANIISIILNYFPKLMVLSIYGKICEDINTNRDDLYKYIVEHSKGRLKNIENFQIDYGNERLKVWM